MKKLFIFIGHPAGGKTTTAIELAKRLGKVKVIEVDEIKKKISGSVFGRNDEERELWFREVNNQILNGLKGFDNIVIDEGFFEQKYLDKITAGVSPHAKKVIIEITLPLEEHIRRNKGRNDISEPVKRMYEIWNQVKEQYRIKPDIEIHNPRLSVGEVTQLILDKVDGIE